MVETATDRSAAPGQGGYQRRWDTGKRGGGRSAADQALNSYYGIPAIHKPHWRWLISVYFWLGGIAGGSYVIASIADLVGGNGGRRITRAGRYLSLLALVPCPPLLIFDLGRPERFYYMMRVVKLRSPMSVGVWGLLGFSGFCGLSALIQAARDGWLGQGTVLPRLLRALPARLIGLLGMGPAFFLSSYTGVLLAATAVPLWTRSYLLLGPLFLTSGLSNAAAAIALALSPARGAATSLRRLERLHRVTLVAELALLVAMRRHLGSTLARPLDTGRLGLLHRGGVLGGGLALPLAVELASGPRSRPASAAASALVLVGGLLLRYVIVMAGRASADDPAATFELARGLTPTTPTTPTTTPRPGPM